MGNENGILSSMFEHGQNRIIRIDEDNWFSFAFGNEIALVTDNVTDNKFYILNCNSKLWEIVHNKIEETKDITIIKKWWKDISKEYEISDWSADFTNLEEDGGLENETI